MDPKKLCPYCEGEYSILCDACKEPCERHVKEAHDNERSMRETVFQKCERCDKPV